MLSRSDSWRAWQNRGNVHAWKLYARQAVLHRRLRTERRPRTARAGSAECAVALRHGKGGTVKFLKIRGEELLFKAGTDSDLTKFRATLDSSKVGIGQARRKREWGREKCCVVRNFARCYKIFGG